LQCRAKDDDENNLGQILEVLTPAQGYLMFFNNRDLTVSSLVSLSNPYTSSQPIPYFSIFVLVPPTEKKELIEEVVGDPEMFDHTPGSIKVCCFKPSTVLL
jgi:hypothetical protein